MFAIIYEQKLWWADLNKTTNIVSDFPVQIPVIRVCEAIAKSYNLFCPYIIDFMMWFSQGISL